jgi:hypothetical protein
MVRDLQSCQYDSQDFAEYFSVLFYDLFGRYTKSVLRRVLTVGRTRQSCDATELRLFTPAVIIKELLHLPPFKVLQRHLTSIAATHQVNTSIIP